MVFVRFWRVALIAMLVMAFAAVACAGPDPTPRPADPGPADPVDPVGPADPVDPADPAGPADPAPADPGFNPEEYFSGRTITLITGTGPGGGFDTILRLFAVVARNHFPGNPNFVVQNLPGGGQLRGLQEVERSAADGFTAGIMHQRFPLRDAMGVEVPDFSLDAVVWVGNPYSPERVATGIWCTQRSMIEGAGITITDGVADWTEFMDSGLELLAGETEPGNSRGTEWMEYIGGPARMLFGYAGTGEIMAAYDRGELNTLSRACSRDQMPRLFPEWIEQQRSVAMFYSHDGDLAVWDEWWDELGIDYTRVPHILDLPGLEYTDDERAAYQAWEDLPTGSHMFHLPAGTPDHIAQVWRDVFRDVANSPQFVAGMEAQGYEGIGYTDPETLSRRWDPIRNLSPDALQIFSDLVGPQ